jgi:hypothetical protein
VRVVPVAVRPSLFRRVGRLSIELDGEPRFLVEVVDIPAPAIDVSPDLALGLRQAVRTFDIADVPALEERQNPDADVANGER